MKTSIRSDTSSSSLLSAPTENPTCQHVAHVFGVSLGSYRSCHTPQPPPRPWIVASFHPSPEAQGVDCTAKIQGYMVSP